MTAYIKKVELTRVQNQLLRKMLDSEIAAYKNWIASAVEAGKFAYAQKLQRELELHVKLCHVIVPDDMWDFDIHSRKSLGHKVF